MRMRQGEEIYSWIQDLYPINRSLSGEGNLKTLGYLQKISPEIQTKTFRSGSTAFDWLLPDEWNVVEAFIELPDGSRIAEFSKNNLHLVGYSTPLDKIVTKSELLQHLHYVEDQPTAVPYVTSYYKKNWGFCIAKRDLENLGVGPFRVFINSSFRNQEEGGSICFGEAELIGESSQEILFSTYICHPSMANNESTGPTIATAVIKHLSKIKRHYTYRFLFLPETVGTIAYLARHLKELKENLIAGWVLTCLGDKGNFSYIPSRYGNNYADKLTKQVLGSELINYKTYHWLDRGSDERQYCAPGVDLPICSITRNKYGTYPEYHTSLDNLDFIDSSSLEESFELIMKFINEIESTRTPKTRILCEPQFGKRNLYPNISKIGSYDIETRSLMDVLSYMDGTLNLEEISMKSNVKMSKVLEFTEVLLKQQIITI